MQIPKMTQINVIGWENGPDTIWKVHKQLQSY